MKLVYFYIQSYGCLQNRGFLFDARYSVTATKENDGIYLSVKETGDCLDSVLYGNVSFTAIVGDNGAGKSTCLDALQAWLVDFDNNPGFVIWENEGEVFYQSNPYCKVKIDKIGIELREYRGGEAPLPLNAVFFSDVLDDRIEIRKIQEDDKVQGRHVQSYEDISTIAKMHVFEKEKEIYPLRELQMDDSLLQIQLVEKSVTVHQEFPWSDTLGEKYLNFQAINFSCLSAKIHRNALIRHENETTLSKILKYIRREQRKFDEKDIIRETLFLDYIEGVYRFARDITGKKQIDYLGMVLEITDILFSEYMEDDKESAFLSKVFCGFNQDSYLKNVERVKEKYSLKELELVSFEKYVNLCFQIMKMPWIVEGIKENHSFMEKWCYSSLPLNRIVSVAIPEGEFVQYLYSDYIATQTCNSILTFKWDMSSGENSICLLFARLYEIINNIRYKDEVKAPYLVMIDEIDNLYHPKWQQRIVNWIAQFLNNVFPWYKFHVIITTHSPVLLSDIPKSRVIFMPKEDDVNGTDVQIHKETFAANIATLYYDAFFMHEGSIGEMAKTMVDMLYEILTYKPEAQRNSRKARDEAREAYDELVIRRYIIPKTQDDINHNKSVLYGIMSSTLNRRYRSYIIHKMRINETNASDIVSELIDIVGEDIWREQLRVMYNNYFTLRTSKEMVTHKIQNLLSHYSPQERAEILKEIQ